VGPSTSLALKRIKMLELGSRDWLPIAVRPAPWLRR